MAITTIVCQSITALLGFRAACLHGDIAERISDVTHAHFGLYSLVLTDKTGEDSTFILNPDGTLRPKKG